MNINIYTNLMRFHTNISITGTSLSLDDYVKSMILYVISIQTKTNRVRLDWEINSRLYGDTYRLVTYIIKETMV